MKIVFEGRILPRLVMTYSPILGVKYELRNVLVDETEEETKEEDDEKRN
jgi:hypothetical protein